MKIIYKDKKRELELLPSGRLKITSARAKRSVAVDLNRAFCEKSLPAGVPEAIRKAGGNPTEWYILREGIPGQSSPAAALPDITREAVEAAIEEVAAAMQEKKEEEEKMRKNNFETVRGHCPVGYVIARQIWRNGDLCAAKYRTEDGIEVLASDLLDPHDGGWYYLPVGIVEAERTKQQAEAAKKAAAKAAVATKRTAKFAEALASGKPVVLRKWMTAECTENLSDCSFDAACEIALPDGKMTKIEYTHCF